MRPYRALELFACEGGATRGLIAAGFEVTAVDLDANRLKRNPAEVRVIGDAVDYARRYAHLFDFAWWSAPCQGKTAGTRAARAAGTYSGPDTTGLIGATRNALFANALEHNKRTLYAGENVEGAAAELRDPLVLCGGDFDLEADDADGTRLHLQRHRLIETNFPLEPPHARSCRPYSCRHDAPGRQVAGVYGGARKDKHEARHVRHGGYVPPSLEVKARLLGLEGQGLTLKGLEECVPPAYAEHVAMAARRHLYHGEWGP